MTKKTAENVRPSLVLLKTFISAARVLKRESDYAPRREGT